MSCCGKCQLAVIEKEAFAKRLLKIVTDIFLVFSFIFLIVSLVSLIWAICDSDFYDCEHLSNLLNWKNWIECAGGCFTLWIISYNLEKFIDVETVKALGDLRTKLNEDSKCYVHRAILNYDEKKAKESIPIGEEAQKTNPHPAAKGECLILGRYKGREILDVDVYDYLGTLELGAIMLRRGVVSYKEFFNQFGYRIIELWKNERVREAINGERQYYRDLLYVIDVIKLKGDYTSF